MRLVLQCSVCGMIQGVGAAACETCKATGLQNLRLMFECTTCFRLGLSPACAACDPTAAPAAVVPAVPPPAPPPVAVVPSSAELEELWGVESPAVVASASSDSKTDPDPEPILAPDPPTEEFVPREDGGVELATVLDPDSEFELTLDDPPVAGADDDHLRLDDELELGDDD